MAIRWSQGVGPPLSLRWGGGQRGGISRSLRGSHGLACGRDGCLKVTSEQRVETERKKKAVGRWQRKIAGGNAGGRTRTPREKSQWIYLGIRMCWCVEVWVHPIKKTLICSLSLCGTAMQIVLVLFVHVLIYLSLYHLKERKHFLSRLRWRKNPKMLKFLINWNAWGRDLTTAKLSKHPFTNPYATRAA